MIYGSLEQFTQVYNTEFHKYCVFDEKEQKFEMKYAKEIRKGDLISTFNIN